MLSFTTMKFLACMYLISVLHDGRGAEVEIVNYNLLINISDGNWPIFLPSDSLPLIRQSRGISETTDAAKEAEEAKASLAEAMAKLYTEASATTLEDGGEAISNTSSLEVPAAKKDRMYWLRKCSGSGCPYAASWMAHINLYKRLIWNIDNTKMEAASFEIFDRAHLKFQLEDHTAFFVHHLSHFEHAVHKYVLTVPIHISVLYTLRLKRRFTIFFRRSGFELAENLTKVMALAAFEGKSILTFYNITSNYHTLTPGECTHLEVNTAENTIAFIPFFGGRPPGVTASLQVKSIGQGNSLVGPEIKVGLTVCSQLLIFLFLL